MNRAATSRISHDKPLAMRTPRISPKDLDLSEAATLAAILPSPGTLAPDRAPALAKEKRDRVLRAR